MLSYHTLDIPIRTSLLYTPAGRKEHDAPYSEMKPFPRCDDPKGPRGINDSNRVLPQRICKCKLLILVVPRGRVLAISGTPRNAERPKPAIIQSETYIIPQASQNGAVTIKILITALLPLLHDLQGHPFSTNYHGPSLHPRIHRLLS